MRNFFIVIAFLATTSLSFGQWTNVGSPKFTSDRVNFTSIKALSPTNIFVAHTTDLALSSKISVQRYNGESWSFVGNPGFSPGTAAEPSLEILNNFPVVVFIDGANNTKASVMRFDGTTWVYMGTPGFSTGSVSFPKIAVSNGIAYVAFQEQIGANRKASVMRFNGTIWEYVGMAGFSTGNVFEIDFKVQGTTPYISFREFISTENNKISVMSFNGTSWNYVGAAGISENIIGGARGNNSLTFAPTTNIPHIAISERSATSTNQRRVSVRSFNGSTWTLVGTPIPDVADVGTQSVRLLFYDNKPTLAYANNAPDVLFRGSVVAYNGNAWINVGTTAVTENPMSRFDMVTDGTSLYLSYADDFFADAAEGRLTVKKYNIATTSVTGLSDDNMRPFLFPNPASDIVNIKLSSHTSETSVMNIHNSLGRIILSEKISSISGGSLQLNVKNLPVGFYFVEILQNNRRVVISFVKQ